MYYQKNKKAGMRVLMLAIGMVFFGMGAYAVLRGNFFKANWVGLPTSMGGGGRGFMPPIICLLLGGTILFFTIKNWRKISG
jgi:hypothetical protein